MSDPVTYQEARLHLRLAGDLDADEAVEILESLNVEIL